MLGQKRLFRQWKCEDKGGSFSKRALRFNTSSMRVYHGFHITESEPETFYIMDVTRMCAVKFFEDPAERFFVHPNAIVFNANFELITYILRGKFYQQIIF